MLPVSNVQEVSLNFLDILFVIYQSKEIEIFCSIHVDTNK
jgi:hypothetical protein